MSKKRMFILGAGLAGLSAAWFLQKNHVDCQILEKESEIGGLCRSRKINGFVFDLDGHLLHFKHRSVFNLVKRLMGSNLARYQRSAWVYAYGRFIPYPFQANLHSLPHPVIKDCIFELIHSDRNACVKSKERQNFLDWINYTFGKGIAKYFMVPYNTKFWTISPDKLNCDWVEGFVPVPTFDQMIEGGMNENKKRFGYNAQFWYPKKGGINQVVKALAGQIKNIRVNSRIVEIDPVNKVIKMASGDKEKFDYLISTIPLPELPGLIKGMPLKVCRAFNKLRWNSIFNLNIGLNGKDISGRHWTYFPEEELCYFRVGFPHNFSSSLAPAGKSSLYVEVSYSKDKPLDRGNIVQRIKKDLKKTGLLPFEDRICAEDINDIKYGYPIYDKNYRIAREEAIKFLIQNNIMPCGRYGSWRYMSMEDTILDGRFAARNLNLRR